MIKPQDIYNQLTDLTAALIASSLCEDQNYPSIVQCANNIVEISITEGDFSVFLKNIPYYEMYNIALEKRLYNIKMLDGALITLSYKFSKNQIIAHRLAYFPAPDLEAFQNEPEIYMDDELYADILDNRIVTVPIRFDFDINASQPKEHPVSHLTLGQYKNCRIPVSSALTPYQFIQFITYNFYNSAKAQLQIANYKRKFEDTILQEERELVHINTPLY